MIIRKAIPQDAPGLARVRVDTWRSAYSGLLPDTLLADLSLEASTRQFRDFLRSETGASTAYIAEDGEAGIIGFVLGGSQREEVAGYGGEVYALYVRQEYQRQGIGRRLLQAMAGSFRQQGITSLLLWSLSQNPHRRFYEILGGIPLAEKEADLEGLRIRLTGYGWPDLSVLG